MKRRRTSMKKKAAASSSSSSSSSSPVRFLTGPRSEHPRTGTHTCAPSQKPLEITRGKKPYSLHDLIPLYACLSRFWKLELQMARKIPINVEDILVKPDREIISIIRNSPTLRIEDGVGTTSEAIRPLKLTGLTAVVGDFSYGKVSCRRPWTHLVYPFEFQQLTNNGALFILLVPSHNVVNLFVHAMFAERFNCIVVSAEGHPDVLIRMAKEFDLPVLAFLDTDPRAFEILAFYGRNLNNIKWLGIRPTDVRIDLLSQPSLSLSMAVDPMTCDDFKTLEILLEDSYINSRPEWRRELDIMLRMKHKIEVEIVNGIGLVDYVTDLLLPMKLQNQDWI